MGRTDFDASSHGMDVALRRSLGFDADESIWLQRIRESESTASVERIGPFELLDVIGRGGQGIVYRALQPGTGREIAVKRLSAGVFATPTMRARFEREIEASVVLDHPNIVTVFGTEEVDGQTVLAMRYVDGQPIDRWARPAGKPRRDVDEILRVFLVVCDAVHHAHQRGVIHRDLKPPNILVDAENRPFVLDFGLAKLQSDAQQSATITMTGDFLGTPAFAAPEQVSLDTRAVDVRTDVYSLGAVLYHLLTGALPIGDHSDVAAVLLAIQREDARVPSSLDAGLNREMDAILLKAVAKEKAQRFPTVDAFSADVRRYLAGEAVLAHPPNATYRLRKFVRMNRVGVAVGTFTLLLLAGATTVSTSFYLRSESERRVADERRIEAQRQQARAEKEAKKAGESSRFVTEMLAHADRTRQQGNPNVTVREVLDRAAQRLDSGNVVHDPELEASVRLTIANTFSALGLEERAEPHYVRALTLLRETQGEMDLRVAEAMDKLATHYEGQARFSDADSLKEGVLRIRRTLINDPNDPLLAETYSSLAVVRRFQGRFAESELLFRKSFDLFVAAGGEENGDALRQKSNLADLYLYMNRPGDSELILREVLATVQRLHQPPHESIHSVQENLAMAVYLRNGNRDPDGEAESLLRAALASKIQLDGDRTPSTAFVYMNLSDVLLSTGRIREAGESMREAVFSAGTERLPSAVNGLVYRVLVLQGRSSEVEDVLRTVLQQREPFLGASHPVVAHVRLNIGQALYYQGRFAEAEPFLLQAEEVLSVKPLFDFVKPADVYRRLAALYSQWDVIEPLRGYDDYASFWRERLRLATFP